MSMFVLSKWLRVALQTRWRASVRALFYCYLIFLDHRTNISRKVRTPRRVRVLGVPNKFQNCHLDKTNMDKTSQHRLQCNNNKNTSQKGMFGINCEWAKTLLFKSNKKMYLLSNKNVNWHCFTKRPYIHQNIRICTEMVKNRR